MQIKLGGGIKIRSEEEGPLIFKNNKIYKGDFQQLAAVKKAIKFGKAEASCVTIKMYGTIYLNIVYGMLTKR